MNLLFPDEGLVEQLNRILGYGANWRLFTNNLTPTLASVVSDFTEAAWAGYSPVALNWTDFTINGVSAHKGFAIASPISFDNSSGGSVTTYGYYVTDSGATMILAAARFDGAPLTILAGGAQTVIPVWGDASSLAA